MTIYLDTSATTPVDPKVVKAMQPYFSELYGNPGSMHNKGLEASNSLEEAREKISKILNCQPEDIIFTGSGTESINLALKGYALRNRKKGNHIITTTIEHHAVLDTLEYLTKQGFEVTQIPVEKNGIVLIDKIKQAIREDTILISVMYANNEIGTLQPIKEISQIAKQKGIIFHTDACQAPNSETLDVNELGIDMLSLNGSKIYGPKGVGCLYRKKGINLEALIHGGGQEFNLRSGTENIPNIVGFTKALEIAQSSREEYTKRITELRDYLVKGLLKINNTLLNGDPEKRIPNNVNVAFLNVEGEAILLDLDEEGICASSGSACTSKSLDPSHVILAMGGPYEVAQGSIRFSLSKYTTKEELDYVIEKVPGIIKRLRKFSPVKINKEELQNE
jgi:cysteine desulfurase